MYRRSFVRAQSSDAPTNNVKQDQESAAASNNVDRRKCSVHVQATSLGNGVRSGSG